MLFIAEMNPNNGQDEPKECCICMIQESSNVIAFDLNLSDIPDEYVELAKTDFSATKFLFQSCCCESEEFQQQLHYVCSFCIHHLATSFGANHPVGIKNPMIPCPYPFKDCITPTGIPNYFTHTTIERLLNVEEIDRYRAHVNRYQFPGFELVTCPRPSRYGALCGAGILVSLETIQTTPVGKLIIRCDQSQQCQRFSCYHCHTLIHRTRNSCDYCATSIENTNPKLLNCYFQRQDKVAGDGKPNLYRNDELTKDIIINHIKEIVNAERLEVKCTECSTLLYKTELCNTLEHCGIERCYSCGRSGTTTKKLGDHWDSSGHKGCPRYDQSIFWNTMNGCGFMCVEGECYGGDKGDCDKPEHASGISNMITARKQAHIYHALKSLLPELRQSMLDLLWLDDEIRPFMPQWWADDYRTFLPDAIRSAAEPNANLDPEIIQSVIAKTAMLKFIPINYPPLPPVLQLQQPKQEQEQIKTKVLFNKFKNRYIKPRKAYTPRGSTIKTQ